MIALTVASGAMWACERNAPAPSAPAPSDSTPTPAAGAPVEGANHSPTAPTTRTGEGTPPVDPARSGGEQTGPAPMIVTSPRGEEVLVGVHPVGENLPAGIYTCARCHMVPSPDLLPRDRWPAMLTRMNDIITHYQLGEALSQTDLDKVIEYFVTSAPIALPTLPVEEAPAGRSSPVVWHQAGFGLKEDAVAGAPIGPVIAGVRMADLDGDERPDTLLSDAKNNALTWVRLDDQGQVEAVLAEMPVPSRSAAADLDGDGDEDIAVACLGSLAPTDDLVGSLRVLVRESTAGGAAGIGEFRQVTVLEQEPRLCDVRPVDLDGDGDLDLAFASFGLYHTGRAGWLEQTGAMEFRAHTLLSSAGVSHVPVGDVNGDGRPDVVAMLSQQHEKVMLYLNHGAEGSGAAAGAGVEGVESVSPVGFSEHEVWRAPHPLWGNSSCELVDLDGDGDLDVLMTNGDALDGEPYSKPWHGVSWLENMGVAPTPIGEAVADPGVPRFEHRTIGAFHGAYWAGAADFDADGDLDVFAVSMMNQWNDRRRQAQVWFENDGEQGFTLWPVNIGPTFQVIGDVGDLDGDRRPDVVTGGMYVYKPFYRVARAQFYLSKPAGP